MINVNHFKTNVIYVGDKDEYCGACHQEILADERRCSLCNAIISHENPLELSGKEYIKEKIGKTCTAVYYDA